MTPDTLSLVSDYKAALNAYSGYKPASDGAVSDLLALLSSRQNTSPRRLEDPAPSAAQVEQIFSAASAAPDHGLLNPWRFICIEKDQRPELAKAFVLALLERDPGATQEQLEAASDKAFRSPFLALAVSRLGPESAGIRHIEQVISLGCAIQNTLLAAHALGFGSGLTSGRAMSASALRKLFGLALNEEAACFIAIGSVSKQKPIRLRPDSTGFLSRLGA